MQIKSQLYKIKGMNKDLSYSIFNPEYSWENKNIRISAIDSNNLMSVTNERGNLKLNVNIIPPQGNIEYEFSATFSNYPAEQYLGSYSYLSRSIDYLDEQIDAVAKYTYSSEFIKYLSEQIDEPELVE